VDEWNVSGEDSFSVPTTLWSPFILPGTKGRWETRAAISFGSCWTPYHNHSRLSHKSYGGTGSSLQPKPSFFGGRLPSLPSPKFIRAFCDHQGAVECLPPWPYEGAKRKNNETGKLAISQITIVPTGVYVNLEDASFSKQVSFAMWLNLRLRLGLSVCTRFWSRLGTPDCQNGWSSSFEQGTHWYNGGRWRKW
jgi:hypothetical protein